MTPPDLQAVVELLRANDRAAARRLLTPILRENPRHIEAWMLMAEAVEQKEHQLDCLMRVLALDPRHPQAQERLARLTAAPSPPPGQVQPVTRVMPTAQRQTAPSSPHPTAAAHNREQRQRGYRNMMLAGALILSALCGLALLVPTVTIVAPRGRAIRAERLRPTPEPILYQATLWCPPCEQAGSLVILWEKVGDGVSRGGKVGELPHNTLVAVHAQVWSDAEGRFYFQVSSGQQRGWVPETFVQK